jgi:hypothetical protein
MPADDLDERGLPARIAGWAYGIALGLLFGWPFGVLLGAGGIALAVIVVAAMFVAGFTIRRIMTVVPEGMANAFVYLLWPSGRSTPSAPNYSAAQALAVRGDLEGALSAYRLAMTVNPRDAEPRIQAAEMFFRSDTPGRAVPLFLEARRLAPGRDLYVTQRLIDLYLGPLGSDVRAMVELKHLVDCFPGTREAEAAQKLYEDLKAKASAPQ